MIGQRELRARERARVARRLSDDLSFYCSNALKIRDKNGVIVPFVFNRAQRFLHAELERQKRDTGRVRALVLKGRQQGVSLYTSARFWHKTHFVSGTSTFILSHQASTTRPLFDIVKRYIDNLPEPITPKLDKANENQIKLSETASEYYVGTAGNEDIGRGLTIRQLHCSEAAWYKRTDDLETGLFQAVTDTPGSEIILESTANGMGNMFHRMWNDAVEGNGEYIDVFIPWFWQEEYYREPLKDFTLTQEEHDLKRLYDLSDGQIYWRRLKIISLKDEWKFKREFPNNASEAFTVSGNPFFSMQLIAEARKRAIRPVSPEVSGPRILGVDCARTNDRIALTLRQGRAVLGYWAYRCKDLSPEISIWLFHLLADMIVKKHLDKVFIDWAQGYGTIDLLRSSGFTKEVVGVHFGSGALEPEKYLNKRAEMAFAARDWLEEGICSLPDDEDFIADLSIIPMYQTTATGKMFLPPKVDIKKIFGKSTDIFDSFILTFAYPVNSRSEGGFQRRVVRNISTNEHNRGSELTTLRRISGTRSGQIDRTVSIKTSMVGGGF